MRRIIIGDNEYMKLKSQLRFFLKKHDITASQLARKSGVPRATISDWLGGTTPKNLTYVKKVADALSISVDELCFGEEEKKSPQETVTRIDTLIGSEWITGLFEVRLRRIKK